MLCCNFKEASLNVRPCIFIRAPLYYKNSKPLKYMNIPKYIKHIRYILNVEIGKLDIYLLQLQSIIQTNEMLLPMSSAKLAIPAILKTYTLFDTALFPF